MFLTLMIKLKQLFKSEFILSLGIQGSFVLNFLFYSVASLYLQPSQFGEVITMLSVLSFFMVMQTSMLNFVIVLSKEKDATPETIMARTLGFNVKFSIVTCLLLMSIAPALR